MANSVLNYIINVVKKGNGDKETVNALQSVKSVMTGVGIAAGVATTAYVAYDKVIGESVRTTVKYADEVRKLMSVTKQNAEETSRMIQVADDYKVTSDQLLVATKRLATQGYAMSIETLAKLSDEYKSLATAEQKQQFLTKNLGKTGQDYITLLEAGGDVLRANAEAQNKNLILTEAQVRAARQLEIAQDELADAQQAYSIAIGTKVIPAQVQFEKGLARLLTATSLQELAFMRTIALMETEPIDSATRSYMAMAEQIQNTADATAKAVAEQTNYAALLADWSKGSQDSATAMKEMGYAALQTQLAMDGIIDANDYQKLLDYRLQMGLITQEEYNAARQAQELKDQLDKLDGTSINVAVNFAIYGMPDFSSLMGGLAGANYKPGVKYSNKTKKGIAANQALYGGNASQGSLGGTNYSGAIGDAAGGWPGMSWTVVGEHGKELIGPDGYIYSNAQSRRLAALGIAPVRGFAVGGEDPYTNAQSGAGIRPSRGKQEVGSNINNSPGRLRDLSMGLSSGGSSLSSAVSVSAQAAQASVQASQNMVNVSVQSAEMQAVSNERLIDEIKALRRDILTGFRDSVQQIVTV